MPIKVDDNGPVWRSERDIRREFPNVSFPRLAADWTAEVLSDFGYELDEEEPRPDAGPYQRIVRKAPEKVGGKWVSGWSVEDVSVPVRDVKAEANRRITAIVPEWKQRNLLAQAIMLLDKGKGAWTLKESEDFTNGKAVWAQVAAIRAASDAIEAMTPIPRDFHDDKYWP